MQMFLYSPSDMLLIWEKKRGKGERKGWKERMRERELSEVMVPEEKHQTEEDRTEQNLKGHNFIMDWKCVMQEKI